MATEKEQILIEAVRKYPVLYDKQDMNFKEEKRICLGGCCQRSKLISPKEIVSFVSFQYFYKIFVSKLSNSEKNKAFSSSILPKFFVQGEWPALFLLHLGAALKSATNVHAYYLLLLSTYLLGEFYFQSILTFCKQECLIVLSRDLYRSSI